MYDEKDYKESNEEGCQEIPDYLPISCTGLLRELHDQITNTNSEQCIEENISHFEHKKSEIGEEKTQPESLPLCHDSF